MKILRYLTIATLGLAMFVIPVYVHAEEAEDPDASVSSEAEEPSYDGSKLEEIRERIKERRAEFKAKLSEAKERRVGLRCEIAQKRIGIIHERALKIQERRTEVYQKITGKLDNLATRLEANDIDTSELTAALEVLDQKIETFYAAFDEVVQSLEDLKDMECTDEPAEFVAALAAARDVHLEAKTAALDIRKHVVTEVVPILKDLKKQVKDVRAEDSADNAQEETE